MSDATIPTLVPRTGVHEERARDCGVARVIPLPEPPIGRIVEPVAGPGPRTTDEDPHAHLHTYDPGPLARALMAMAAAERG